MRFDRSVEAEGGFGCRHCGSPSILPPTPLAPAGPVLCGGCREPIATWASFCRTVERRLALLAGKGGSPRASSAEEGVAGLATAGWGP